MTLATNVLLLLFAVALLVLFGRREPRGGYQPVPPEPRARAVKETQMFLIAIGVTVKDRLTGFTGVVSGRADYITGCNQYLVRPTVLKPDGDIRDGQWMDEQRLEVVDAAVHPAARAVQQHTVAAHPGADSPAPIK